MIGTILWNLLFAVFGGSVTFILSLTANSLPTSVYRAATVFAIFYLSMFLFRAIFAYVAQATYSGETSDVVARSDFYNASLQSQEEREKEEEEETARQTSQVIRDLLQEEEHQ
ncbi:hypothetical protein ACFFGV_11370 [Pontibacillus salicampi]|uniref:Uncharacterized protein n=1 Tax=Pontibacillus salicampi TaxID=1449801 RepID=A0ABV6LPF1_9BACI